MTYRLGMSDEMAKVIQLFNAAPQAPEEDVQPTQMQVLHVLWEDMFAKHGQSLTDPRAAQSLRAAIAMMDGLLDGANATWMIDDQQRDDLRAAMHVGLSAADEFQGLP